MVKAMASRNTKRDRSHGRSDNRNSALKNKVYVSNIDFACNHQDIKEAFQCVGEVAFVEMLKNEQNKPKGCAIVRFKESDMTDLAVQTMNRKEFRGRKLVVREESDSRDRSSRDRKRTRDENYERSIQMPMPAPEHKFPETYGLSVQFLMSLGIEGPLVNRVFAANLDYSVDEESLKELFSIAGKVEEVELVRGDDNRSKGFGFIDFSHPLEAVQAISMLHKQTFRDRPLSVQLSHKKRDKKKDELKLPLGLKSVGNGLGANGAPLKDIARTFETGNQLNSMSGIPSNSNFGNISSGSVSTVGGMGVAQSGFGGAGLAGSMPGNIGGGGLGGSGVGGGLVGMMDRSRSYGGDSLGGGGLGRTDPQIGGGSSLTGFASPPEFTNSLTTQRNVIQISNLPSDYTWKSLQNLCQSFGEVTFAKINSRGVGIVHFDGETAARRALEMLDQQRFEGRVLEVIMV